MSERATDHHMVTHRAGLDAMVGAVADAGRCAIDTESASFHRYADRLYLAQVATEDRVWVIDPLAVTDLEPLGRLLADRNIETILHDADFDLRTLNRDYGFVAANVFDTRVAAELAGEASVGLAALLERHFGVRLDKRFQRADWSMRPLSDEMLAYAADDTRYLVKLRDLLARRLAELDRLAWAEEDFQRIESVRWERPDEAQAYLRLKGAKTLSPRQRAALRELYAWRDDIACRLDRSPFRVAANEALVAAARALPTSPPALRAIPGMSPGLARRHGKAVLAAVRKAVDLGEEELPNVERRRRAPPDEASQARFDKLRALRARRAADVALAPGLVCPNAALMALARSVSDGSPPDFQAAGLKRWQRDLLGEDALIRALEPGSDSAG